MSRIVKVIEPEIRFMVAKGCGDGRMGNDCFMSTGFPFEVEEMFWN